MMKTAESLPPVVPKIKAFNPDQKAPPIPEPKTGVRKRPPPSERDTQPEKPETKPPPAPPLGGWAERAAKDARTRRKTRKKPRRRASGKGKTGGRGFLLGLESAIVEASVQAAGGKLSLENVRNLIKLECDEVCTLLIEKNRKYNNSVFEPVRVFSKASPVEQIKVRIDDKLKRIQNLGPDVAADEDTVFDLIGYLLILRVARRLGLT